MPHATLRDHATAFITGISTSSQDSISLKEWPTIGTDQQIECCSGYDSVLRQCGCHDHDEQLQHRQLRQQEQRRAARTSTWILARASSLTASPVMRSITSSRMGAPQRAPRASPDRYLPLKLSAQRLFGFWAHRSHPCSRQPWLLCTDGES